MSKQVEQYRVEADAQTSEWLAEPEYVGLVDFAEWVAKVDTDQSHFDTVPSAGRPMR